MEVFPKLSFTEVETAPKLTQQLLEIDKLPKKLFTWPCDILRRRDIQAHTCRNT